MIFLLVAIVIVTNIIIIYTCTYTFSSKERTVQEVTVKDISQKSPIVVEALEENEENLEEIYPTGTTKYYIKVNCKSQTVNVMQPRDASSPSLSYSQYSKLDGLFFSIYGTE